MRSLQFTSLFLLFCLFVFTLGCSDGVVDDALSTGESLSSSFDSASGGGSGDPGDGTGNQPGVITAGEWNDLEEWAFWQHLMINTDYGQHVVHWKFLPTRRIDVRLTSAAGQRQADMPVHLYYRGQKIWSARTDLTGRATLWADLFNRYGDIDPADLAIVGEGTFFSVTSPKMHEAGINEITVSSFTDPPAPVAEVAFVVDATGSMGDELEYLKVELQDVLNQVKSAFPQITLRTGSVFYRDIGDEYVTRHSPLTANTPTTIDFIGTQAANGGGDFPEAVHTAFAESVNQFDWSSSAQTRLMFFVLDAPPHHNDNVLLSLAATTAAAAAQGIRVIPVTASGIDKETEFLMRLFAMATDGTYVFITDHSGIGNDHLEPSIGEYEVEFLNDLMVRLIKQYLEN